MTKANALATDHWLPVLIRRLFMPTGLGVDATWAVFFIPAAILLIWVVLDFGSLKILRRKPVFRISTRTMPRLVTCTRNIRPAIC